MAIKLPTRNFLTFRELLDKWQCNENDIREIIIRGELKPSYFFHQLFARVEFFVDGQRGLIPRNAIGDDGEQLPPDALRGHYYLQDPLQITSTDCVFQVFSDVRDADKTDNNCNWWAINNPFNPAQPFNLSFAMAQGVVMQTEIARFESREKSTEPLGTKERDTLLKLLIGMAIDAYGYDPTATRSPLPNELAGILASRGMSVTDDTVRKYLKLAADTVLPAKPHQS